MNRRKFLQNGAMAIVAASVAPAAVLASESPVMVPVGGIIDSKRGQIATMYECTSRDGAKTWIMRYKYGIELPVKLRGDGNIEIMNSVGEWQA